jgi:hypothetical protein
MKVCKDCGTEYNNEFLQCPNCGSSRVGNKEEEIHDGFIGTLVTLLVVGILCAIIGLGIYYVLHPFNEGDAMSDLPETTTSTTTTTTTTTATEPTSTGVLNHNNPGGGDHGGGANMVTTSSTTITNNVSE